MQTPSVLALLQVVPRDGLSRAADISLVIVAATIVVLAIAMALVLLRVNRVLTEVRRNVAPVAERARGIAENVEHITHSVRGDVERVNESVQALTDKLKLASERMEERIEDFNALMEVVQEEAEGVFIETASTVRGVRAGARSIVDGARSRELPANEDGADEESDSGVGEEHPTAQPAGNPQGASAPVKPQATVAIDRG